MRARTHTHTHTQKKKTHMRTQTLKINIYLSISLKSNQSFFFHSFVSLCPIISNNDSTNSEILAKPYPDRLGLELAEVDVGGGFGPEVLVVMKLDTLEMTAEDDDDTTGVSTGITLIIGALLERFSGFSGGRADEAMSG